MRRIWTCFIAIAWLISSLAFAAPTNYWTGATNGLWSDPSNWLDNVAPVSGNNLVFPANAIQRLTTNDLPDLSFDQLIFQSSNYEVQGYPARLTGGILSDLAQPGTNRISALSLQNDIQISNSQPSTNRLVIGDLLFNSHSLIIQSTSDIEVNHLAGPAAGLTKAGPGSLVLSGTEPITDIPMAINEGTLSANAESISSPVDLQGGTLIASGFIPNLNTLSGAIVPGPSIQTLRTTDLQLNPDLQLEMEILGTAADRLSITGSVNLSYATLRLKNLVSLTRTNYLLLENDGTDPVVGEFAHLPEGTEFTIFPTTYQITYAGGTGNDVVLTAISNRINIVRAPYLQNATTGSVVVCWRTAVPCFGQVLFGTNVNNLNTIAAPGILTSNHQVQVSGLLPGTKYYYFIDTSGQTNMVGQPDFYFITPPVEPKPIRLWAIGDAGTGQILQGAVRNAYYQFAGTNHTDVWLMLGDNAYNTGSDTEYQNKLFGVYGTALRKTLLWTTIGNHDAYGGWATMPYLNIFNLPTAGEAGGVPSGTERYYSFDYGNIHFICLDSMNPDVSSDGPMCTWLKTDLQETSKDWIIAFWHQPPYSKGTHDSDWERDLVAMRENAVPILESYGVDLVLCGHSHVYERSYLLRGHYGYSTNFSDTMKLDAGSGRTNDTGPYIKQVNGPQANFGAVYVVAGSSGWSGYGSLNHPAMFYSTPNMGSFVADINGLRLDAKFLRENGAIDDHFTIIKQLGSEVPRILRFRLADGSAQLQWSSDQGASYEIQETLSLENPSWTTIASPITATTLTTTWTSPESENADKKFFRIRKLP